MQLADLGAEVIKVEGPGGDYVRKMAFPIVDGISLLHWHLTLGNPTLRRSNREAMYGRRTYDADIPAAIAASGGSVRWWRMDDYVAEAARRIGAGEVIGWFQGPSELGPRALGNRSILADPRRAGMRDYVNRHIKGRELFRPLAPAVLKERSGDFFATDDSPFMLKAVAVRGRCRPATRLWSGE